MNKQRKYAEEMLLMLGCPHCGAETNRKYVESVIDAISEKMLSKVSKMIETIMIKVGKAKTTTQKETGAYKYDFAYDECKDIIEKYCSNLDL